MCGFDRASTMALRRLSLREKRRCIILQRFAVAHRLMDNLVVKIRHADIAPFVADLNVKGTNDVDININGDVDVYDVVNADNY